MKKFMEAIDGRKTYIALAVGAIVLIAHKLGVPMPGVNVDDMALTENLWQIVLAACGRSALNKIPVTP